MKSGFFTKTCSTKLKSQEMYAQVALDNDLLEDEVNFHNLPFNLFVAGDLRDYYVSWGVKKECFLRLSLLKQLAYKHGQLSNKGTLALYACFIRKVEQGSYKWGSKSALQKIESSLMFWTCLVNSNNSPSPKRKTR